MKCSCVPNIKQANSDAFRLMHNAEFITNFAPSAHLLTWSLTSTRMLVQGYGIGLHAEYSVTSLRRPNCCFNMPFQNEQVTAERVAERGQGDRGDVRRET